MKRQRKRGAVVLAILALGVGAFAGYGALTTGAHASASGAWAPGVHAPVGAMSSLPAIGNPPAGVAQLLGAQQGAGTVAVASTLHLLRGGLGSDAGEIYGYETDNHAVCMILWPQAVVCPIASESTPGIIWLVAGGGTGVPGANGNVQPAFAGIVDDSVASLTLTIDGTTHPLAIGNNAFFAELAIPASGDAWSASLQIAYKDGSQASVDLPDPRPVHLPSPAITGSGR